MEPHESERHLDGLPLHFGLPVGDCHSSSVRLPTRLQVESNPTATLTADEQVRGMVVEIGAFVGSHHRLWISNTREEFGVANGPTSLAYTPHAKFHHAGVLGLVEACEQRGRAQVMLLRDGIQVIRRLVVLNTLDRKSAPLR
jgi:hypothetical protein